MALTLQSILNTEVKKLSAALYFKTQSPRIVCMDGTSLSVQTGKFLHCLPRNDTGPWHEVEVGYPSRYFKELQAHDDGGMDAPDLVLQPGSDTYQFDTTYSNVPIEIVESIIEQCGGICEELTLLTKDYASH